MKLRTAPTAPRVSIMVFFGDRLGLPALLGVGVVAGVLGGLLGLGGATVMIPLLIILGMSQRRATGTSLAAVAPILAVALMFYYRSGVAPAPFYLTLPLLFGAIIGSLIGARWAKAVPEKVLRISLVGMLSLIGIRQFLMPTTSNVFGVTFPILAIALLGLGLGLIGGSLSSALGVGNGLLVVPALGLLFGFEQHVAQATSLMVMIPACLSGAITHRSHGNVDLKSALYLSMGGVLGAMVGATWAVYLHGDLLARMFGILMLLAAIQLWRRRHVVST